MYGRRLVMCGVVVGGCTPDGVVISPPVIDEACVVLTAPPAFLAESDAPVQQRLIVSNPCEGAAEILGFDLDDPVGSFSVGAPDSAVLEPGEQTTAPVRFDPPRRGLFSAFVSVRTSSGPAAEVEVTGTATGPEVRANPVTLDLGDVPLGCPASATVLLANVGEADATVLEVQVAGDAAWSLASSVDLPLVIPAGVERRVEVQVWPWQTGTRQAQMRLITRDPRLADVVVPLGASGTVVEVLEQSWGAVLERDVLFAVDRSCSQADVNAELVEAIPAVVSRAKSEGVDLHLAAIVADTGCIVGGRSYIDASFSASDAEAAMEIMVDQSFSLAPYGSNTERTLMLADAALATSNIGSGGCNQAFYREEAELHIVSVTDDGKHPGGWHYYAARWSGLKAAGGGYRHHLIGSPSPAGCGGLPAAEELSGITVESGGVLGSICGPIATAVRDIAEAAVSYRRGDLQTFILDNPAISSTVEVLVDDEPVTGWTFDETENAVVFTEDSSPSRLAKVTVRYAKLPECAGG